MRRRFPFWVLAVLALAACERSSDDWIRDLRDEDEFRRLLAVVALRDTEPGEADRILPALVEASTDESETVRREVRTTLRQLAPHGLATLLGILVDRSKPESIRHESMLALGKTGGAAVPMLIDAAVDADPETAEFLEQALHVAAPASIPQLVALLDADAPRRRAFGVRALSVIGPGIGADARTAVLSRLGDRDPLVRREAVRAVPVLGPLDAPAVAALQGALEDPSESVRSAAASALAPVLLEGLDEDDREARAAADRFVDRFPDAAVPILVNTLRGEDAKKRRRVARRLVTLGPTVVGPLLADLERRDHPHAREVIDVVAEIGGPAVPAVIEFLKTADPKAQHLAPIILGKIGPAADSAVPVLLDSLGNERFPTRLWSVFALWQIAPDSDEVRTAIRRALREDALRQHTAVADVVAHLDETR
jgi:HEAT repeat protein